MLPCTCAVLFALRSDEAKIKIVEKFEIVFSTMLHRDQLMPTSSFHIEEEEEEYLRKRSILEAGKYTWGREAYLGQAYFVHMH